MAIVSDVEIRLRADIARLQQDLNRARGEVNTAMGQMTRAVNQFKNVLGSLGVGLGLGALVGQVIGAQREFDKLNASLITITGSSKAAREVFGVLQEFAAKTPYSLQEVTEGFLKLRNLGLTPSERALTSYGNTASAMGKNLNQLIEAVADAATGEFERLKEFGIKAKQQGDQVSLTFQGVTTKVGNNAAEIEKYLMQIGEVNFAGAMSRQADTLDGDLSALSDTWKRTLTAFSTSGFGDTVRGSVMALSAALVDLQAMFKAVTSAAAEEGGKIQEISPIHQGLTTFFEAIMVLGTNVAYVFKTIGKDIGAFAAQAAVLFTGGFQGLIDGSTLRGVQEIGRARVAEAKEERRQVDETSAAILGAAQKAQEARNAGSKQTKDRLEGLKIETRAVAGLSDAQKKAADTAKKAEADRLKNYQSLIDAAEQAAFETNREALGLDKLTRSQQMAMDLDKALTKGKITLTASEEAYYRAVIESIGASEDMVKANEAAKKAADEERKAVEALENQRTQSLDAARTEAESAERLVATFGMSAQAIEELTIARLEDQRAQLLGAEGNEKEIEYLTQLIELKQRNASAVGELEELQKTRDMWESIEKTAHDTFVSIMDGGKDAATRLKDTFKNIFFDWLYQQTLKKWIINLQGNATMGGGGLSSLADMFGGATGGGSSGGSGFLGGASNLLSIGKTIYQGFTGGLMTSLGTTITNLGTTFGSAAVAEFGAGMSGVAGSNLAAGTAASAGATSASVIPIIGWIIAGMNAANGFFKQGFDMQNGTVKDPLGLGSGIKLVDKLFRGIGLSNTAANIFSGQAVFAKLFGRANPVVESSGLRGEFNSGGVMAQNFYKILEKGGVFRSDKRYEVTQGANSEFGQMLTETFAALKGSAKDLGAALGVSTAGLDDFRYAFDITFSKDKEEQQKQITDLLSGLGDSLANTLVPNLAQFAAEGETAAATLQRLATNAAGVNQILQMLGVDGMKAFGAASIEARERLLALTGGVDALAQQTSFFAQNFLTDAARMAPVQKQVTDQLAALGYAGVKTTDQFAGAVMDLVNGGGLATEAGARTYAALLALAPAFKQMVDYTEQAKTAAEAAAQAEKDLAQAREEAAEEARQAAAQALRDTANDMFALLQRSVNARKDALAAEFDALMERLGAAIEAQQDKVTRLSSLQQALAGTTVGGASDQQLQAGRAKAQADIATALAIAKASGVLPTSESIKDALAAVSRDAGDQFATLVDAQRDQLRTQNNIEELAAITGRELTTAERTLASLESQRTAAQNAYNAEIARLDAMVEKAQQQLDAINGVRTDVTSIPAAFKAFADSILAALQNQVIASQPSVTPTTQIEALYNSILGRASDAAGLKYYLDLYNAGASLANIAQDIRNSAEYRGGLYTTQQAGTMGSGDNNLAAAVENLSTRWAKIEGALVESATATTRMSSQIDQVTSGGNAMRTELA